MRTGDTKKMLAKLAAAGLLAGFGSVALTGCDNDPSAGDAIEDIGDGLEDAADDAGDAIDDAVDEVEDAVDDATDDP